MGDGTSCSSRPLDELEAWALCVWKVDSLQSLFQND